jgi:hypothetical protein
MAWKTALALFALCASLAAAGEEAGLSFSRADWELVCDNTRACRMAGYSAVEDAKAGRAGSVLITRAAGANTPLEGKVTLADFGAREGYAPPRRLTFYIDGQAEGVLELQEKERVYPLTSAQTQAIIAAARKDGVIAFEGETQSFTLSDQGVSVVLLKMDEAQGRIGTPGALIRTGEKPEEGVLPPLPAPVIRAVKVRDAPSRVLGAAEVTALKPLLTQSKGKQGCMFDNLTGRFGDVELEHADFTLTPLDERHVLISTLCWQGAYSDGYAHWVMDSALSGTPKFVTGDAYDEDSSRKDGYSAGRIISRKRRLGKEHCWSGSDWVWDGREFRQSADWHSGQCYYDVHLGGAWRLPAFVSEVVSEDRARN